MTAQEKPSTEVCAWETKQKKRTDALITPACVSERAGTTPVREQSRKQHAQKAYAKPFSLVYHLENMFQKKRCSSESAGKDMDLQPSRGITL